MTVSVIITCYNEGDLLLRAYNSLEQQLDKDFEIIVINDFSKDNETNSVCRALEKRGVEVIWRKKNGGLSEARNTGFKKAKGEIIVPLDADDILPANAVKDIKKGFSEYKDADFIFGNYLKYEVGKNEKNIINCNKIAGEDKILEPELIANNWILLGTSPCKKATWEKVNAYNSEYSNTIQDVDFWIRVLKQNCKGYYINKTIYNWHRQETGMNNNVKISEYQKLRLIHSDFFIVRAHIPEDEFFNDLFYWSYAEKNYKIAQKVALKGFMYLSLKNKLIFTAITLFPKYMQNRKKNETTL